MSFGYQFPLNLAAVKSGLFRQENVRKGQLCQDKTREAYASIRPKIFENQFVSWCSLSCSTVHILCPAQRGGLVQSQLYGMSRRW